MRILAALFVIGLGSAPAFADADPASDAGEEVILFGRGKSLWRIAARGGEAVEIVRLGFAARNITALDAGARGRGLLISAGDEHYFARVGPNAEPVDARLACRGRATLSGNGRFVLCLRHDDAIVLRRLHPGDIKARKIGAKGRLATLRGGRIDQVVAVTERGLESFPISRRRSRELLARQSPQRDLLIAPDGRRAVAVFADAPAEGEEGGEPVFSIYQFLLDGKGVKRKLISNATAVKWSRDSRWVLSVGPRQTCVARARGGQYRCWKGFRAADLAPSGDGVLLLRGKPRSVAIHRASLAGARSARPKRIVAGAHGAAALWLRQR